MAEVRKKVVEDKYNTQKIKKNTVKKEVKVKNDVQKHQKNSSEEKKSLFTRFRIFCHGVKEEFHRVHWTSKDDMVKYSIATIFFIIFFALFFYLIDVIFALIRSLIG